MVPDSRIRAANTAPVKGDGDFVLYWMTAFRRTTSNFAIERAVEQARHLRKPLVVLEALRSDHPWASARLHHFVIQGMADQARAFSKTGVTYLPYVEPVAGAGRGLVAALAARACLVVTDDYPCFFLPAMLAATARSIPVRVEAIDANGLLPMRLAGREFKTALSFRSHLQRTLRSHLDEWPAVLDYHDLPAAPAAPTLASVTSRWRFTPLEDLRHPDALVQALTIDQTVPPVEIEGGARAARSALARFVSGPLSRYANDQNQPEADGTSGLSPYLHFGHLSIHDVFEAVMTAARWTSRRLGTGARGKRDGWWGVGDGANAFLDQCLTWRELGFNACVERPDDYDRYRAVPDWARNTLAAHATDRRDHRYTLHDFDAARTADPVWNAAQRQLVRTGWMHNYLRMLWGKKILEWSPSAEDALETMTTLMNRHALDGRDPNSYSGYLWVLGRYDRPWGPARPIFGTVRYMSSANTVRKLRMKQFLIEYGPE